MIINFFNTKRESFIDFNRELNILNNREVDIVCCGPSSFNVELKTETTICPNSAILNSKIINNKNINVIWIVEHKFYSDKSYEKKIDLI